MPHISSQVYPGSATRTPDGTRYSNQDLIDRILQDTEGLGREVSGLESGFEGLENAGDVAGRFGLDREGINRTFGAQRRNLSTSLSRSRGAAAERLGSGTAVPEAVFGGIEGQYAQGFGNIDAAEGSAITSNDQLIARILQSALGNRDQFNLGRGGLSSQILNQRGRFAEQSAERGYLDEQRRGSFLDDLSAGLDIGSKVLSLPFGGGGANIASSIFGGGGGNAPEPPWGYGGRPN